MATRTSAESLSPPDRGQRPEARGKRRPVYPRGRRVAPAADLVTAEFRRADEPDPFSEQVSKVCVAPRDQSSFPEKDATTGGVEKEVATAVAEAAPAETVAEVSPVSAFAAQPARGERPEAKAKRRPVYPRGRRVDPAADVVTADFRRADETDLPLEPVQEVRAAPMCALLLCRPGRQ